MPTTAGHLDQETGKEPSSSPMPIWFLHAGGVPLSALGAQFCAFGCLGAPKSFFDHDEVMIGQMSKLGTRSFEAYVEELMRCQGKVFSAFIAIADLAWLEREKVARDLLYRSSRFVHVCYRDPVLQALNLLADREPVSRRAATRLDEARLRKIQDTVTLLDDREECAKTWISRRGKTLFDLSIEGLAAEGVAALRHLLDHWSLDLPAAARIRPISPPSADLLAQAQAFREEASRRQWGHALLKKTPHWRR